VKKKLKNVTHTVGAILEHRRRTPDKAQFVAQIKEKGLLSGGVGLVLYFVNMKKKPLCRETLPKAKTGFHHHQAFSGVWFFG
jgi:hypothetical protein